MKYCSIVVCHFAQVDSFGGLEARWRKESQTRSEMLKKSLESLCENTDYPYELIVMDNGGNPDDTDWLVSKVREGKIDTLVRYKDNMNFSFAWNQGFRLATGDYVCFTCNDILYEKDWLGTCIGLLERYPDRKLLATPYVSREKNNARNNKEILEDGTRINTLAGSNCFIIKPEDFKKLGEIPHHRVGGSVWHRRMCRSGYMVIAPKKNMVLHFGYKAGTNFTKHV